MIDRYRKKGGFVALVSLIETSAKEKQEKFLKLIKDENPEWESSIRAKMLTLDTVLSWPNDQLREILAVVQPVHLGMIIGSIDKQRGDMLMNLLGYREKKAIEQLLLEKKPTAADLLTSVGKLFVEVRKLVHDGVIKFEKFNTDLLIDEDIEENLGKSSAVPLRFELSENIVSNPIPEGTSQQASEEISQLRRRVFHLSQENQKLQQELHAYHTKFEQIKKLTAA